MTDVRAISRRLAEATSKGVHEPEAGNERLPWRSPSDVLVVKASVYGLAHNVSAFETMVLFDGRQDSVAGRTAARDRHRVAVGHVGGVHVGGQLWLVAAQPG